MDQQAMLGLVDVEDQVGPSYRDVEELLAERGIAVDHVTVYRWVQRFTPLFADDARCGTPPATAGSSMRRT